MPEANSEQLLTMLVELKKEEMKRTRNHRVVTFIMITLPTFLLIVVSVWAAYAFVQNGLEILADIPSIISEGIAEGI